MKAAPLIWQLQRPFKVGHSDLFFLYFRLFNTVDSELMNKILPMTGFELRTSCLEAAALPTEPQP